MKFEVQREAILQSVQHASRVSEKRGTDQMVGQLLLELTDSGGMSITGSDRETWITSKVEGKIKISIKGSCAVTALFLEDICRQSPENCTLKFKLNKDKLEISAEKAHFVLDTLSADDFPTPPQNEEIDHEVTFPVQTFRTSLDKTKCCMATTDWRQYLMGTLIDMKTDETLVVATDGHRMAIDNLQSGSNPTQPIQAILPRRAVNEIINVLKSLGDATNTDTDTEATEGEEKADSDAQLTLKLSARQAHITCGGLSLTTLLINATYPDYLKVIPSGKDFTTIPINQTTLRKTLERIRIMCDDSYAVKLKFKEGRLRVSAGESAEIYMDLDQPQEEELDMAFNINYLLDVLNNMEADTTSLHFFDNKSITEFRQKDDDKLRYLVMPMLL